ncbi:MAG TPA: PilZ domain-containing protein [Vicinamibacterales bacterium]|nr:PilZ domain-containing protein [Vicinamibacterales bacterium]
MHIAGNLESRSEFEGNRRYAKRRTLTLGSLLHTSGSPVVIRDLSLTGLSLETKDRLSVGELLLVSLPECGPTAARVVWQDAHLFGCEFEEPVSAGAISAALLMNPPARQQQRTAAVEYQESRATEATDETLWPVAYRVLLIIGLSAVLWALILAIVF